MKLDIRKFDPGTIKKHRVIVIIGKRGTGKSVLLTDLMYHMRGHFDYGIAFTPTESSADTFKRYMPESCIYDSFRPDVLETLIAFQRDNCDVKNRRSLFVLMDDCLYDKGAMRNKCIRDIFMNGRHRFITLIIAAQYMYDLGPDLRTNIDYVFTLRDPICSNRIKLFKNFFSVFDNYQSFGVVMDSATDNHGALVLDNTVATNKTEECVFWYRASEDLPRFYVVRRSFYRLHTQHAHVRRKARPTDVLIGVGAHAHRADPKRVVERVELMDPTSEDE
jgi:hypothetical protein